MSKQLECEVLTFDHPRIFVGIEKQMNDVSMFQEAKKLANTYGKVKGDLKHLVTPVHTAVITFAKNEHQDYVYFMGDEVTKAEKLKQPLVTHTIPKGTLVARISIPVGSQLTLSYKVADIRKQFYTSWLKEHGYVSHEYMEDMELYHYRRRRLRKALKMVMELYFFIEKAS